MSDSQHSEEEAPIFNLIKYGLIALGGYKLYKAGAFEDVSKGLLEVADKVAKSGDNSAVAMSTIKQWTKLKHLNVAQLANSNQAYNPPIDSIFRERNASVFYSLAMDIKDFANGAGGGISKFTRTRTMLHDSAQDLRILKKMINDNVSKLPQQYQSYSETKLALYLREIQSMESVGGKFLPKDMKHFSAQAMKQFTEDMTLSSEKRGRQLRETGYRDLVLGDLIEQYIDADGLAQWRKKANAPIDIFSPSSGRNSNSFANEIRDFYMNPDHWQRGSSGVRKSAFQTKEWENIIVDNAIKVNAKGNIIDFRMTRDNAADFANSLMNDFWIPVVRFNPIKSALGMVGIDNPGLKIPHMGLISPTQIDPTITGLSGRVTIGEWLSKKYGDVYKDTAIGVIGDKGYIVNKNNQLVEVANNLRLHDITNASNSEFLTPTVNAMRQMAGLTLGEPEKYSPVIKDAVAQYEAKLGRKLTTSERLKFQSALFFDMGFQEYRPKGAPRAESFDSSTNIDEIVNSAIDRKTRNIRVNGFEYDTVEQMMDAAQRYDYSSVFGEGFSSFAKDGTQYIVRPRKYVTTKKGFTLTNAFNEYKANNKDAARHELKGFFAQFASGRKDDGTMGEFFTERTGRSWSILNNLNTQLADNIYFLGFSAESKKNVSAYLSNFLLKRALPVYMLTKVPGMINYFSEPFFNQNDKDGTDNRDNISKFLMREVVRPLDIMGHQALDLVGATNVFKFLGEFTPGADQINELPFIYQLGLSQTGEERKEYIKNGMDPIRKGRFWGSGNTPFTGDKIIYWRPNIYRRIEADVDFSDSKWGSRQEYYNNAWFPNPVNPFAPINHFITQRNHYDRKHYYDRPYLITAPEGSNIPIIGPAFGATIGKVINPPHYMHKEYWKNLQINPSDELPSPLVTMGSLHTNVSNFQATNPNDYHVFSDIERKYALTREKYVRSLYSSSYQAKAVVSTSIYNSAGVQFNKRVIYPSVKRFTGDVANPFELYTSPSGAMTVVDIPNNLNLFNVNRDLKQYSINKILGTNQRVTVSDMNGPGIPKGNDNKAIDNAFIHGIGHEYNTLGEVAGLRGFMAQQFITGKANQNSVTIENSGYAYSINSDFWGENLGGLGSNLSEITRRFIPKKDANVTYINPIRNTMPSWMPGSNYFTDFKHGDSYSKIDNGEERLPGQGYERLYGIKNLDKFNVKLSNIGKSRSEIIKSFFPSVKQPGDSDRLDDIGSQGNKITDHIKSVWKQKGLAFATNGYIDDKRNHITGAYDAMVYDLSSPTGVGVVDIRTVSKKDLNKIRLTRRANSQHQQQVNYLLWATDNMQSKGYVHYVNRDNPEQTYTVGFNYNDRMLQDSLKEIQAARKTMRFGLDKGIIGRGEMYSLMDRYRILADVAPYSQEFKDVQSQLSMTKLSDADKEEARQIRDKLKQQKEPFRVYPYKFKTSNLQTKVVTVKKIIDNNTFITNEFGDEHAIKFAGIKVTESSELVNKKTYPRKRREGLEKIAHNIRKKLEEGPTRKQKAHRAIRQYIRPGQRVEISYDADEHNMFKNDSVKSIRAVVRSNMGTNVNRALVRRGYATLNENDNSPAGINVRYTKGEIAFGSAMENLTHKVIGAIPFIGSKVMQVKSPYERYRDREVYGKDFQSWNYPIRDIFIPNMVDKPIGDTRLNGMFGVISGAFIGSLFGKNKFGKLVGGIIGGGIPLIGKIAYYTGSTKEREWRPKRRREQESLNEYVDILKYVKNMRLYAQYSDKAKIEDHFDVQKFIDSKEAQGTYNKLRKRELERYKKQVKLDFKHRNQYQFQYGPPKYVTRKMDYKTTIKAVNQELKEISGDRSADKLPLNALKAISFKQAAEKTMYAYNPGDSLVDIMSALPKKDRQYFKYFINAPEEEKTKILRIAPSYMRRALQGAWGLPVDRKPTLQDYFTQHALPDANWIGWDENADMDAVKVKMVHANKMDPGEFDIWRNNQQAADGVNIPIPRLHTDNSPRMVQMRLQRLFGKAEYDNIQVSYTNNIRGKNGTIINVRQDARESVSSQIDEMDF